MEGNDREGGKGERDGIRIQNKSVQAFIYSFLKHKKHVFLAQKVFTVKLAKVALKMFK